MKIPTPTTWEVTLSEQGNKAECWENLMKSNKLPFMAMLRNIRNMLITGVDNETHHKVFEKLRNPDVIQNSRMFPFRFLSAYESAKVNLEELHKIKTDPDYVPPQPTGKRSLSYKAKVKVPQNVPSQEILDGYKEALEESIKLATALNVSPIRGHTVIFCDASGSMRTKISSGPMGSVRTCMDLGYLFGIMLRHVCESCEVLLVSSPNPPATPKCWRNVELTGENIFNLLEQVNLISDEMGRSNEYPYDWFDDMISEKKWIDNIIIFSDMIISDTCSEMFDRTSSYESSYEVLKKYRDTVNPEVRYITVDLAGYGRDMLGVNFESQFKNIVIGGYSDAILKLVSSTQTTQAGAVRECKAVKRGHNLDSKL